MMPKYYYLNRPPSIGCQPDGFTERECWMPMQQIPGSERMAFGRVTYPEHLEFDQVWKYDLLPAAKKDQAEMVFWREGDDAGWIKEDYMGQPVEFLKEHKDRCRFAWAALVLKGEIA